MSSSPTSRVAARTKTLELVIPIERLFDQLAGTVVFVVTAAIVLLSVLIGSALGRSIRRRGNGASEAPIGTVAGALLSLLAFILALTFGMAASGFDSRKALLLDEVNAIETAFLRAGFLPEPQRAQTQALFKTYVDIAAAALRQPETLPQSIADAERLHEQLWAKVMDLPKQAVDSVSVGLYVQSLNEVMDLHAKRLTIALQYRIPRTFWWVLFTLMALAMGSVGYQYGISGTRVVPIALVLAVAFSSVIYLIEDLDRVTEGLLKVSQQPMLELQQRLRAVAK
jgi:hypothetical protein